MRPKPVSLVRPVLNKSVERTRALEPHLEPCFGEAGQKSVNGQLRMAAGKDSRNPAPNAELDVRIG